MNKNEFIEELNKININISEEELNKFETYKELLKESNKKFNLTSIVDDENIYLKHFYDSLCLSKAISKKDVKSIIDIGTGAGFPGIPLAIIYPNVNITLLESNAKKCTFLKEVVDKLNLTNVNIINERAEIYAKNNREKYDVATSRAVSNLSVLLEIEIPLVKENGYFLPLKAHIEEELEESKSIIKELDVEIESIIKYTLPKENSERTILIIKKNKKTNSKYPREYNKIIKDLKKRQN